MSEINYIKKRADKFVQLHFYPRLSEHKNVIDKAKNEIYGIDDDLDKVFFLRVVLEANAKAYKEHLLVCTEEIGCAINYNHESVTYFLTQELNRLGIRTNNDQFTSEEKIDTESKLDQILRDMQELKYGHQIIYEDLKEEIESLKELFILGKKTWFQLLVGKTTEMTVSGIISETASKAIVSALKEGGKNLLTQ